MTFRRWLPIGVLTVSLAAAACGGDQAAPFEVEGTGTVTGRLFFDSNLDGIFTPLAGDTLLPNVEVEVRERSSGEVIASGFSDAEGYFEIDNVKPGTHDIIGITGQGYEFCRAVRTSVYRNEQAFALVGARRQCVQRIIEAEGVPLGDQVTFVGIVIARPGQFRNNNLYIVDTVSNRDSAGAIQVFNVPGGLGLEIGDQIEVSGPMAAFGTERQIDPPRISNIVKGVFGFDTLIVTTDSVVKLPSQGLPTNFLVGQLITIRNVRVGTFNSSNTNAPITDPSTDPNSTARMEIRVESMVRDAGPVNGIPAGFFDPAKCYDITGILGIFNDTRQIKPRSRADVVEVTCPTT